MADAIKIALSGVGNRALPKSPETSHWTGWAELLFQSEHFKLIAAHDVSEESLQRIVDRKYLSSAHTFTDLDEMLSRVNCEAIIICNPAEHHAQTLQTAVDYGLHMLIEKPFVNNLEQGIKIVSKIEDKALVACVVQNWRYKSVGLRLQEGVSKGLIGRVGHVFFRYVRNRENPNYPPYIFDEPFPLLYAMGIHHFDLFRFILQDEIASIKGHSFKPPWSMYKSWTGHNLFMYTEKGSSISYTGTISSQNSGLPQESLIVEGEKGSLVNNSDWLEPPVFFYQGSSREPVDLTADISYCSIKEQYDVADRYLLDNFRASIKNGQPPLCSVKDGLRSVAVVEAARVACETKKEVFLEDMVDF